MSGPIDLTIQNDFAELPTISQTIDRIAIAAGMHAKALAQLQVALDEILSNVIKYAWPDGGSHQLHVTISLLGDAMEVTILDDGRLFDPSAQLPSVLPPPRHLSRFGGLGIHMVRQLVDGLRYARDNGCNRVTLTKRYASGLPQQEKIAMTGSALTITETHSGDICILALAGRVDSSNAGDLATSIDRLITSGAKSILVDLAAVLYLTSAAFRALLVATDEAERNAARFALCSLAGHVRELFEMGGMIDVFTIHKSREEAIASLA